MKSKLKKSLSLLLALVMAMSCMSLGAFAEGETTAVAKIGETGYDTLQAAITAANAGDTVLVVAAGTYTLPDVLKNITIKGDDKGVVFSHTGSGNIASIPNGATFDNVSFIFGSEDYHGFQHAGDITMKNCTLNGKFFSYGNMTFESCTFNAPGTTASGINGADYAMWDYGEHTVTYSNCHFYGAGKFLHVYRESADKTTVYVNGCDFHSTTTKKAAVNVKATYGSPAKPLTNAVTITNCTTDDNFPTASKNGTTIIFNSLAMLDDIVVGVASDNTITVNNKQVYPEAAEPAVAQIDTTKYETLEEAFGAASQAGEATIKLLADATDFEGCTIESGKNITLDLNGNSVTTRLQAGKTDRHEYLLWNHGTFTLMDSNPGATNGVYARGIGNESDGTMIINSGYSQDIDSNGGAAIWNEGTLTVNGGTFEARNQGTNAIYNNETGTITMNGGTAKVTYAGLVNDNSGPCAFYNDEGTAYIHGGTITSASNRCYAVINYGVMTVDESVGSVTVTGTHGGITCDYGTLTVNGGTFTCTNYYGLWITNDGNETEVTINGGSFTGGLYGLYATVDDGNQDEGDVTISITGGAFKGGTAPALAVKKGSSEHSWGMTITGGKFSSMPDSDYINTGYEAVANTGTDAETYPYIVQEIATAYVAQTGDTQYETVEAAIAAAANNGTVTLLTDASLTGTTDLTLEKSITLDLAGHTLTANRINLKKGGLNVVSSAAGGTVTSSGQTFNVYGSETNAANYTTLTIGEGVTVNGNYAICLFPVNGTNVSYGATINVNGRLTGTEGTVFVSGNLGNTEETGAALASSANISVINVGAKAVITGSGDQAIAMNGMAKVNVVSGAVITGREAVGLKRGILNVTGGTFTANGAQVANPAANNNGTEATGAALSITSTYNYAGSIQANISGGYFTSVYGAAFLASEAVKNEQKLAFADGNPILMITGGVFDDDTVKIYVASGYEAAALNSANNYGGEAEAYNGWYKVGVLTVSSVAEAEGPTANYDVTYTASKTVTTEDNSQQLAAASTVTVNVVTAKNEDASSAVVANTDTHTTAKYDVASVVESAIGMANTTDTTLNVFIDIVSDKPAVDKSTAIPTITYEIHPVATVTSQTGTETPTPVGSFKVTNEQLGENAEFELKLTVPDEVRNAAAETDGKRYVIAKHVSEENGSTETYKREIKGIAGGYYIELTVTHFSQFELEPMTLDNAVGEAKVSATLSLSDSIDIIFYVKDMTGVLSNYRVEYSFGGASATTKAVTEGTDVGGEKYSFTVASCAAKQMTDTVSFKVYYDSVVIFSINDYSIQSYCENKIAASGTAPKLRELCYAVLDYGASAQNFFDYKTSNIANATYSKMSEVEALTLPNNWEVRTRGDKTGAGVLKNSATLNTVSQTEIYFYITPTGTQTKENYTVSAFDATKPTENTSIACNVYDQNDGRILAVVSGIAAKYLGDMYTLTVNGVYTVDYSPMSYAYNKQYGAYGLGNLVKAMYQYSVKAAAFFE